MGLIKPSDRTQGAAWLGSQQHVDANGSEEAPIISTLERQGCALRAVAAHMECTHRRASYVRTACRGLHIQSPPGHKDRGGW